MSAGPWAKHWRREKVWTTKQNLLLHQINNNNNNNINKEQPAAGEIFGEKCYKNDKQ